MTYIGPRAFAIAFGVVCGLFFATFIILDRVATTFDPATASSDAPGAPAALPPSAPAATSDTHPSIAVTPAHARTFTVPAAPTVTAVPTITAVAAVPAATAVPAVAPTPRAASADTPRSPRPEPANAIRVVGRVRNDASKPAHRPATASHVPLVVGAERARIGRSTPESEPVLRRRGSSAPPAAHGLVAPSNRADRRAGDILVPVGRGSLSNDGSASGEAILVPIPAPRITMKPES